MWGSTGINFLAEEPVINDNVLILASIVTDMYADVQEFVKVVQAEHVKEDLIPMFHNLANDEQVHIHVYISRSNWTLHTSCISSKYWITLHNLPSFRPKIITCACYK